MVYFHNSCLSVRHAKTAFWWRLCVTLPWNKVLMATSFNLWPSNAVVYFPSAWWRQIPMEKMLLKAINVGSFLWKLLFCYSLSNFFSSISIYFKMSCKCSSVALSRSFFNEILQGAIKWLTLLVDQQRSISLFLSLAALSPLTCSKWNKWKSCVVQVYTNWVRLRGWGNTGD